jgi:acetoin utilization protein AcuB
VERIPAIKSVMTPFPYSIDPEAEAASARAMMDEHEIRHLPVKHGDSLVGVVSDRDIERALDPNVGLAAEERLRVKDVMVAEPYVVDLNERLDNVLLRLADQHDGCVLVVKHGRLAGIFTSTDACRVFGQHLRSLRGSSGNDVA